MPALVACKTPGQRPKTSLPRLRRHVALRFCAAWLRPRIQITGTSTRMLRLIFLGSGPKVGTCGQLPCLDRMTAAFAHQTCGTFRYRQRHQSTLRLKQCAPILAGCEGYMGRRLLRAFVTLHDPAPGTTQGCQDCPTGQEGHRMAFCIRSPPCYSNGNQTSCCVT